MFFFLKLLQADTNEIKETINSINDVIDPIRQEFESDDDFIVLHESNDYLDDQMVIIFLASKLLVIYISNLLN